MPRALGPYFVAQVPGWIAAALVLGGLYQWAGLPGLPATALLLGWIVKDVLLYPVMRRFYEPEPAGARMIGETGVAVTRIAPDGLVRVRGELWKARSDRDIPQGARVRIRGIEGLTVIVGPAAERHDAGAADKAVR